MKHFADLRDSINTYKKLEHTFWKNIEQKLDEMGDEELAKEIKYRLANYTRFVLRALDDLEERTKPENIDKELAELIRYNRSETLRALIDGGYIE